VCHQSDVGLHVCVHLHRPAFDGWYLESTLYFTGIHEESSTSNTLGAAALNTLLGHTLLRLRRLDAAKD
jgi:hypothetical protein